MAPGPRKKPSQTPLLVGRGYPQCIFPGIEFAGSAGASAASARVNGGVAWPPAALVVVVEGLVAGQWKNPGTKRPVTVSCYMNGILYLEHLRGAKFNGPRGAH